MSGDYDYPSLDLMEVFALTGGFRNTVATDERCEDCPRNGDEAKCCAECPDLPTWEPSKGDF